MKSRQIKASDDSNDDELSPECVEFTQFWFGPEISKNQLDAAYVELAKGKALTGGQLKADLKAN